MALTDHREGESSLEDVTTRLYVLDTSVLIHDPEALRNFRNTQIAIPIFVVMELDDLKTSPRHEVASAARTASRRLVALMEHGSLHDPKGVKDPASGSVVRVIGQEGLGTISLKESASSRKMDLLILSSALKAQKEPENSEVILVSKDVNLRILADSEGLKAEDYNQDRVDESEIPTGFVYRDIDPRELGACYYQERDITPVNAPVVGENEFLLCGDKNNPQAFRNKKGTFTAVPKTFKGTGIVPRNLEQRLALDLLMDPSVQLVTLIGKAGTGKSFLALAAAIAQLDGVYDRVILSKPVVAMGRDLGYLPGTESDKMAPWMLSFYDNLDQLMSTDKDVSGRKGSKERSWEQLFHSKKMEIQPLHSIRGRSIAKALMIVDEGQNMTPHEVKTVVSRAATGTKVILCGDPYQIDDAYLDTYTNGLVHAATAALGNPIAGTMTLTEGVRSPLAELAATKL